VFGALLKEFTTVVCFCTAVLQFLSCFFLSFFCSFFLSFFLSFFPSFFLSFFLSLSDLFLPTHCRCAGLLLLLITFSDTLQFIKTPLGEGLAHHTDIYLTTHNVHNKETFMPLTELEPTIPANEWLQTHAFNHTATGIVHLQPL